MRTTFSGYTRRDRIIAFALSLAVLALAGMQLTCGMRNWGDDFAAYISEGIAISTGTLKEQAVRNYTLHLAQLPEEASSDGLVYVWGFPLLLSLVHRAVGFDTVTFSSIIWYKLPSLIALSLTSGVLYLYYRRRFSQNLSVFLTLILCLHNELIQSTNNLHVDILYLFTFQLSLLLSDCYLDASQNFSRRTLFLAVALGAAMWYTCVTRLNGVTIVFVVAASHLLRLLGERPHLSFRNILLQLLPYLTLGALWYGIHLLLPEATSNLSDVGKATPDVVLHNIWYYCKLLWYFYNEQIPGVVLPLSLLALPLIFVGLYREGLSRKNIVLTCLLAGSFLVLILLPYTQGLRYILNLLPILLLFTAHGGIHIWQWIYKKYPKVQNKKILQSIGMALLIMILALQMKNGIVNLVNERAPGQDDVYTEDSIAMYRYIQENIPEDQLVAFCKSRVLFLNTGRMSYRLGYNGHVLEDADYYLFSAFMNEPHDLQAVTEQRDMLRPVYSTKSFALFEVLK